MKEVIGIAGGAGPFAGADLFRKIIEETRAKQDQEHVPVIVISLPEIIPDRTGYLLGREERNPGIPISEVFLQLEKAGAGVAAIPCNTAHSPTIFNVVLAELQQANSRLRVIHMIEETAAWLERAYKRSVIGILSTTGTRTTGIYRQPLEKRGFKILETEEGVPQENVHQAVYHPVYGIKARSSPVSPRAKEALLEAAHDLIAKGAEAIVLGCSEMPLAIPENHLGQVPLIDPNRVLARALIKASDPSKLK